MSEHSSRTGRDRGLTLPELLITVSMIGLISAAITAAVIVTLRSADTVEGRINLANDEQSLEYDMPTDLASASLVDTDPALTPCGAACPASVTLGGSNVMLLNWTTQRIGAGNTIVDVETNVSYYFLPTPDTSEYQLDRIACESIDGGAWTCAVRTVLRELPGPPGGGLFIPGDTVPRWVMQVSEPLSPDALTDDELADSTTRKDAHRVVVTINGNGGPSNRGGGTRQVSITAGGTTRGDLPVESSENAPSFFVLPGQCGGPITLIVDNSELLTQRWHHHHHHTPILGDVDNHPDEAWPGYKVKNDPPHDEPDRVPNVRAALREFVGSLAGTPTQVQIVTYNDEADVLDPTGNDSWTHYVDLSERGDVDALLAIIDGSITGTGGANYEDGWFRAFYEPTGVLQNTTPDLTVFLQAEFPTVDRLRQRSAPGQIIAGSPPLPEPGWPAYDINGDFVDGPGGIYYSNGADYSQVAFNRADWIADQVRGSTRIVGVGAGDGLLDWLGDPGARYDFEYQRGGRQYQMAEEEYQEAKYEKQDNKGKWKKSNKKDYDENNTTDDETDGWRIRWKKIKEKDYNKKNSTSDDTDGFRTAFGGWSWISAELYAANNTTADDSDGFRDAGFEWVTNDNDAMIWLPTTDERTDGGYRYDKVYSPTGEFADTPQSSFVMTRNLLSRLVTGSDFAVEGDWDQASKTYTNGDVAEIYVPERHWPWHDHDDDWDRVPVAMHTIAMSECGGTVTVSARDAANARPDQRFVFQTVELADENDVPLDVEPTILATDPQYPARAFEFDPPAGEDQWATIYPGNLSNLTDYSPAATPWSCWSGLTALGADDMETVTITDEAWVGVKVRFSADEAVSCQLNVVSS
jgi:prepilin-type N-terminal cleavage/methylation domain-containing protein